MSEKKCLVILISYLKRVGSRTETSSSLPAIWISDVTESLWKARHTWGALGKVSFCRRSADGEAGETLCRASQRDATNCSNNCTSKSCCGVSGRYYSTCFFTPAKAGRLREDYEWIQHRSCKPGVGQGFVTCIKCPPLPALVVRPETCQEGGCMARILWLRRELCSETWKQKSGQWQ